MKWLFFYIINLVSVSASLASTCDVLKVTSQDPINKTQFFGNGFAYTNKLIITNDHILAPDATEVDLSGPINTKALIIHRDFHTDLALLQIRSGQLKACQLNNPSGEEITIEGFEKEDSYLSKIEGLIKNANSGKLLVPGILKSLEIVAHGQMQMRSSQSGSAVLQSGKLIGLVTQKTKEGTALVIGAQDISQVAQQIIENKLPKRKYEIDRRNQVIKFDGLKLNSKPSPLAKSGTGGIDPHSKNKGTLFSSHQNAPSPIALEDYEIGAALVEIDDFSQLATQQPHLFKAAREAQVTRIFVSAIDDQKIRNSLELIRVLGNCHPCKIQSFWIEVKDPAQVQNSTLRLMGWISALVVELEKSNSPIKVKVVVDKLNQFLPLISQQLTFSENGRLDLSLAQKISSQWAQIETDLQPFWHTERTLDILSQIRQEIYR